MPGSSSSNSRIAEQTSGSSSASRILTPVDWLVGVTKSPGRVDARLVSASWLVGWPSGAGQPCAPILPHA
jgi:hypothetical protein